MIYVCPHSDRHTHKGKNMKTVFTPSVLKSLSDDWATGRYSKSDLARKYGVTPSTITKKIKILVQLGLA